MIAIPAQGASRGHGRVLPRSFYDRPADQVAPELLNKVLVFGKAAGRIVEVEAYTPEDEASHSFRGKTSRNQTMFGRPGLLYVYFTYGMHWCANAVCDAEGTGAAVLLRAIEPLTGLEQMRRRRAKARTDRDLCSGPAKLCQALALEGSADGADLARRGSPISIRDDGVRPPEDPACSPRIGISKAIDRPWRWFVPGGFLSR